MITTNDPTDLRSSSAGHDFAALEWGFLMQCERTILSTKICKKKSILFFVIGRNPKVGRKER
jgi:hypothetical protein